MRCSPFHEPLVASCSYDMAVCVWDYAAPEDCLVARLEQHTEFVLGVDYSTLVDGLMASTGWDESVFVWQHGMDPRTS